jgi:hypothetical protein
MSSTNLMASSILFSSHNTGATASLKALMLSTSAWRDLDRGVHHEARGGRNMAISRTIWSRSLLMQPHRPGAVALDTKRDIPTDAWSIARGGRHPEKQT